MASLFNLTVVVLASALAVAATAQPYKVPRNAIGQPDFEGIWSYNSMTRLERPDAYPSVVVTEEQARAVRPPPLIAPDAVGQAESENFDPEGLALARLGAEWRSAWIVDPSDGRLPYTPQGRARAYPTPAFDHPEQRPNQERCLILPGIGPPITNGLYNNHLKILQTRDHLLLFFEHGAEARIVPIGPRTPGPVPRWMGETIGWWEGSAFVMRTSNFWPTQSQRSYPLGRVYLSPDAVVTERLERISASQIRYSYTVEDAVHYTRPWRGEMPFNATKAEIYEYACHEGNYSLANILAGARAQENAASTSVAAPR